MWDFGIGKELRGNTIWPPSREKEKVSKIFTDTIPIFVLRPKKKPKHPKQCRWGTRWLNRWRYNPKTWVWFRSKEQCHIFSAPFARTLAWPGIDPTTSQWGPAMNYCGGPSFIFSQICCRTLWKENFSCTNAFLRRIVPWINFLI